MKWLNEKVNIPPRWLRWIGIAILIILIMLVVAILIIVVLYPQDWSGLSALGDPTKAYFRPAKTLWDWMQLLFVPAILAGAAVWFNNQTSRRDQMNKEDRFREEALQKYFDDMIELLLGKDFSNTSTYEHAQHVASSRTIVVLHRLDAGRVQEMIGFLREAGWLTGANSVLQNIVLTAETKLQALDLRLANLSNSDLSGANLNKTILRQANLSGINLNGANLSEADLKRANLNGANLSEADLSGADLSGAVLGLAILKQANLNGATMNGIDLRGADLTEADLSLADISAVEFDGTTLMPDGKPWTHETDLKQFTGPA